MFHGDIVDQFLNQNGLAHASAAEQADFSPPGVGFQQVDDLNAGLQHLYRRTLLLKSGRAAVDGLDGSAFGERVSIVDRLAQYVEHASQRRLPHWDLNGVAGYVHSQSAGQPLAGGEHDAPHGVVPHMLGHLHHPGSAVYLHSELVSKFGQFAGQDLHIHHRAGYLRNNSSFHIATSFAAAGPWLRRKLR